MPTQEERLYALEFDLRHFKTETIKAYGEIAMEMTMVKGLTEDSIKRLASLKEQVERRFDALNQQITAIKQDVAELHIKSDQQKDLLLQILARLPQQPG